MFVRSLIPRWRNANAITLYLSPVTARSTPAFPSSKTAIPRIPNPPAKPGSPNADFVRLGWEQYARVRPLEKLRPAMRGWTLDVLNLLRLALRNEGSLHKEHFTLADAYALESHLAALHPANHNVRPKIRQQLQILRKLGLLTFLGEGNYTLK